MSDTEAKPEGGAEPITIRVRDQVRLREMGWRRVQGAGAGCVHLRLTEDVMLT